MTSSLEPQLEERQRRPCDDEVDFRQLEQRDVPAAVADAEALDRRAWDSNRPSRSTMRRSRPAVRAAGKRRRHRCRGTRRRAGTRRSARRAAPAQTVATPVTTTHARDAGEADERTAKRCRGARKGARGRHNGPALGHCSGYAVAAACPICAHATVDPRNSHRLRSRHSMPSATDLAAALAYSRYATQLLAAHSEERDAARGHARFAVRVGTGTRGGCRRDRCAAMRHTLAATLRGLRRRVVPAHARARSHAPRRPRRGLRRHDHARGDGDARGDVAAPSRRSRSCTASRRRRAAAARSSSSSIGMGKLGGGELNVSSDIDLVFAYPEERRDRRRATASPIASSSTASAAASSRALNEVTADGFVFRVDMRLRPYGESGPLSVPFAALEQYLVTQGRAWERYAWLKARALTGDRHDELDALVTPFVYRKYLDYDAYEGLRDMHRQIREQGSAATMRRDIKLGPGGIREIEFIVQALQLVRGGREPALRVRGTPARARRDRCARAPCPQPRSRRCATPTSSCATSSIGCSIATTGRRRRCRPMPPSAPRSAKASGFVDCGRIRCGAGRASRRGDTQFVAAFGGADAGGAGASIAVPTAASAGHGAIDLAKLAAVWRGDASPTPRAIGSRPAATPIPSARRRRWRRCARAAATCSLPALSRQRFDALVAAASRGGGDRTRAGRRRPGRVRAGSLDAARSGERRSAYLALLIEHPPLLPRLAQLMGASAWAADYLTRHPMLLDELLDARVLLAEPDWDAWRTELAQLMTSSAGDAERQMDALRHFQHAQTFRLLAQDLAGLLTVERLADHLSALADHRARGTTLAACGAARRRRAAAPPRFADHRLRQARRQGAGLRVGPRPRVPLRRSRRRRAARALRAARAADHHLAHQRRRPRARSTTPTCGCAPTARPGSWCRSLASFRRYQREQAWTWEHQALTRARFVAGDATIGAAFEAEREAILRLPRDRSASSPQDVVDMRRRMHAGHPNRTALFDLKHDRGGMVDIEFAVQYLVLAHARRPRGADAQCRQHRAAAHGRRARPRAVDDRAGAADAYREYRRAAAPDPAHRRAARAGRTRDRRRRAARRRARAVGARVRRGVDMIHPSRVRWNPPDRGGRIAAIG